MIIDCHTHIFPPYIRDNRHPFLLRDPAFQLLYERADIIGFANYQTAVVKTEAGFNKKVSRGVETGDRRLHLIEKPAFVAKNRYSLPESIDLSWSSLADALATSTKNTQAA